MKLAKKILLAAAVFPLVFGTSAVFAYGGPANHKGDGPCGRGEARLWKQLDLTSEQQAQLQKLRDTHRDEMRNTCDDKRAAMKALHDQERALVLAADFDQAAAQNLAQQMVEQQVAQRVNMLQHRQQMMNVLTAEQKAKWQTLQQDQMQQCLQQGNHKRKAH
ncbi:CpxP family protein [Vibrio misgurnus]|uniref:CpxP family protein n=1 Tax=Vibrio misgurnus TaxID=2993714 RepID=UPI0023F619E6|nr:CpxP family protein [Vibrio sp. VCS]